MPIYRHPIASSSLNTWGKLLEIPLDRELVLRLKDTYQTVRKEDDTSLAQVFYRKLFAAHPGLRSLFPYDMELQAKKLMSMLDLVINSLEHPVDNWQQLADLGQRHVVYGVKPEHYTIVVNLLTESMQECLHTTRTNNTIEEWRMLLTLISQQMIQAGKDR